MTIILSALQNTFNDNNEGVFRGVEQIKASVAIADFAKYPIRIFLGNRSLSSRLGHRPHPFRWTTLVGDKP
jgi:hypothetical protein